MRTVLLSVLHKSIPQTMVGNKMSIMKLPKDYKTINKPKFKEDLTSPYNWSI
jgi:hypothetical protein